ncbi:hypothetical protein [Streptomyces cinerochromogenes]|uniref:hypothetical protein n=1 Tax=Streptomyces cinerochromogenes TaxID=66422 RepID=UPI001670585E|nr:hypothetical protein [Streptomyces cinerochromogenes]GGS56324.1 hypothetical protein GCM10010206_17840 [Streptomyces cinerochromogenes]
MTVHMDATRVLILVIATLVALAVYKRGQANNSAVASAPADLLPAITAWAAVVAGVGLLLLPASPTPAEPGADLKPAPAASATTGVAR